MKVLLDATAVPPLRVGVGHYVAHLVEAIQAHRTEVQLHVMATDGDAPALSSLAQVHLCGARSRPLRLLWEQTVLPVRVRSIRPDLFHGPHYTLPHALGRPAVVTFHDPTFFTMPHVHEAAKVAFFTRAARSAVRRAARVVAVSSYARAGAIERAGADPDSVDVVPLGVDLRRYTPSGDPERDAALRAELGVERPYVLWVGALEPRKDVPTLVRAYASLRTPRMLVLAGPDAWGTTAIAEAVAASGVSDRVVRTGYVSEDAKIALYRGADVFVFPSLAEGFGLPVLEAMACGCPVVTTTGSAPEEVGGDAVVTVPPADAGSLADAVRSVLDDPAVAGRLREAGPVRASGFSWDATAAGTVDVWRRALA